MAGGLALTDKNATKLPLLFGPGQRKAFKNDVTSMEASGQPIALTISTDDPKYQGVLGSLVSYDPKASVIAYNVIKGGTGYSDDTRVEIVGGGGTGAMGDVHVKDGVITSIGLNPVRVGMGYYLGADSRASRPHRQRQRRGSHRRHRRGHGDCETRSWSHPTHRCGHVL